MSEAITFEQMLQSLYRASLEVAMFQATVRPNSSPGIFHLLEAAAARIAASERALRVLAGPSHHRATLSGNS